MITSSQQDRDLPFLPTLLCLWGAGWATSLVTSVLFLGRVYSPNSPSPVMVAVNILLSAAIGAIVVRYLLLSIVDCEIPYSATLVALVAGSVASTVARLILFSQLQGGDSPGLLPIAGLGASFLPSMIGAVISWWLLQNAAQPQSPPAMAEPLEAAVAEHAYPGKSASTTTPTLATPRPAPMPKPSWRFASRRSALWVP